MSRSCAVRYWFSDTITPTSPSARPASASVTSTRETTPTSYCASVWSSSARLASRLFWATRRCSLVADTLQ